MTNEIKSLMNNAIYYRNLYNMGKVTEDIAKENINPYLNKVNEKSTEIAKKYNQKPKLIKFSQYVR